MRPERWLQIDQLFEAALDQRPEERAAFLDLVCAGDQSLREQVDSLLESDRRAQSFIEAPAFELAGVLAAGEPAQLLAGQQFGQYQIISHLASGGMGEVYLARDNRLGRRVALKLLPEYFTRDEQRIQRFRQEAQAASALNHPNIITIYEIAEVAGRHYIATEFVAGETLREALSCRSLSVGEALGIAAQVGQALSAAHETGIVHRDIKPENIMLRPDGIVKVVDFGLAKPVRTGSATEVGGPTIVRVKTDPGTLLGTAHYMSPEQARGQELDARSDILSLGVVLYEMISGRQPFQGETASDVIVSILTRDPPALSLYSSAVPVELERIVNKALQKKREERYQIIDELLLDLNTLRRELESAARLAPMEPRELRRHQPGTEPSNAALVDIARSPTVVTRAHENSRAGQLTAQFSKLIATYRTGTLIIVAILAVTVVLAYLYFDRKSAPVLTQQDTVLIADFDNKIGDAVFDGTLKQALAVQLEQSPFLNIFPEERIRETLRYMHRSPDERVTQDVAREICLRQNLKAVLTGSIVPLGTHYVIALEAVNAQTGEVFVRVQTEAESKEQVLQALGHEATDLRRKLGESLRSIQKFDVPIEQATTSSLEALQVFSLAMTQKGPDYLLKRISLFKHAIELDPKFALAYARLSINYEHTGQRELAAEAAQKAFELRDRVSERERLEISIRYYGIVTGDLDKVIDVVEIWNNTYPNKSPRPYTMLAFHSRMIGQYEKAIAAANQAIQIQPNFEVSYVNLARALMAQNRFAEAKEVYDRAFAQNLDFATMREDLFLLAFVDGDATAMRQQLETLRGRPDEYLGFNWQAHAAAFSGHWRQAQELSDRAAELAVRNNVVALAAQFAAEDSVRDAMIGRCQVSKAAAARGLAFARDRGSFPFSGLGLALCGEVGQVQRLIVEMKLRYPNDSLINDLYLPLIQAASELKNNNPALSIQTLETINRYEATGAFWPQYLRGHAYLRLKRATEAGAQFQQILDHRGQSPLSVLYPLARLGLAQAAAQAGDTAKAQQTYKEFFALWKDADPEIPLLQNARAEYAKLGRKQVN